MIYQRRIKIGININAISLNRLFTVCCFTWASNLDVSVIDFGEHVFFASGIYFNIKNTQQPLSRWAYQSGNALSFVIRSRRWIGEKREISDRHSSSYLLSAYRVKAILSYKWRCKHIQAIDMVWYTEFLAAFFHAQCFLKKVLPQFWRAFYTLDARATHKKMMAAHIWATKDVTQKHKLCGVFHYCRMHFTHIIQNEDIYFGCSVCWRKNIFVKTHKTLNVNTTLW